MKRLVFIIATVLSVMACHKGEEILPQYVSEPSDSLTVESVTQVIVVNEGNFGWGNGSISIYDPIEKVVNQSVFQSSTGVPLGDVPQSVYVSGDTAMIPVTTSGNLVLFDLENRSLIGTISGLNSPRLVLPYGVNRALVTNLYGNSIDIIDLQSMSVVKSVATSGWTEDLELFGSYIYIVSPANDVIYQFDLLTEEIVDSIQTERQPISIETDGDYLWVLCSGGIDEELPALMKVDPITNVIDETFLFSSVDQSPADLVYHEQNSTLYFLNSDLFAMNIADSQLPLTPIVEAGIANFYAFDIDSNHDEIYCADAKDYVSEGEVYRYALAGQAIDTFDVGLIPGAFGFWID